MTLREAAQQALEALEFDSYYGTGKKEAVAALKAALEQPEPCRYPDCVDNGPEGKCTRWLVGECPGPTRRDDDR